MKAGKWSRRRTAMLTLILIGLALPAMLGAAASRGSDAAPAGGVRNQQPSPQRWDVAIALAVAIGLPSLGAGYAVAHVGAAALGASSEKPELLMRTLLFVGLAEGIAIYGLVLAAMLYLKL